MKPGLGEGGTKSLQRVFAHAAAFREAILRSDGGGLLEFREFPIAACGDASILLGQFLFDRGFGVWEYVYGETVGGQSHAWIEKDGVIADITADQFGQGIAPVLVTMANGVHFGFAEEDRHAALINHYVDEYTLEKLSDAYELICAFIEIRN